MNYINEKNKIQYVDITESEKIKNGQFYTVISLFSGAGGLDIGLEQAGFHTIACVENDINCRATLKFNRPDWNVFEESVKTEYGKIITREPGDIRDIEVDELLNYVGLKKGQVTLVVGGAPCQPFSNMGKKEGLEDKKNGDLFQEFVRMVKGIQPEAFIFENVAGITQNKHAFVLDYMIKNFEGTGYGISYSILNSANYGVPQRRERFFLIGIKDSKNPAFPLPTHMKDTKSWETFTRGLNKVPKYTPKSWVTVKDAFNRLPKNPEKREDFALMNISEKVVNRMKLIKQGENFKVLPPELRPDCWKSGKHQGNDTFGRLIADLPSVTIRTAAYNPAKGMYIHPFENRGLSTIEMAILQDFPLSWTLKHHGRGRVTLASGGKQIGNAVPPGLARAIGLSIKKQLSIKHSISVEKQVELVVVS
ncbi:MAG: DNA cytosine methyltransferase [Bacteroidota bacterium]